MLRLFSVTSETIVGVNKYRLDRQEEVEVLEIDNSRVRQQQIARINNIKNTRDNNRVCVVNMSTSLSTSTPGAFDAILLLARYLYHLLN